VVVADTGTAIPNGSGNFTGFREPVSFGGGEIAFIGFGSGNLGIYKGTSEGDLVLVADLSTVIPDGSSSFTDFGNPEFLGGGEVAFRGHGLFGQLGIYDTLSDTNDPIITSLINDINDLLGETSEEAAILIEPLQQALDKLGDGNEKNNKAVCGKLKSFIKKVERFEKDGILTTEEANDLIAKAEDIKDLHGCK